MQLVLGVPLVWYDINAAAELRRQFSRGMVCDRSRRTHASLSLVTPSACELPLARTLLFVDCRLRVVPPIATHKGFRFGAPRNRPRENWRETERERERERERETLSFRTLIVAPN